MAPAPPPTKKRHGFRFEPWDDFSFWISASLLCDSKGILRHLPQTPSLEVENRWNEYVLYLLILRHIETIAESRSEGARAGGRNGTFSASPGDYAGRCSEGFVLQVTESSGSPHQ